MIGGDLSTAMLDETAKVQGGGLGDAGAHKVIS